MTNKILDHIEAKLLDREKRKNPHGIHFDARIQLDEMPSGPKIDTMLRCELRVFFEQYVDQRDPYDVSSAKTHAKWAIARHIYGDVATQLYSIQEALWEDGIRNGKHIEKLNQLISELSGEMSSFE